VRADVPAICRKELADEVARPRQDVPRAEKEMPRDILQWLKDKNCSSVASGLKEMDALDFGTLKSLWERRTSVIDMVNLFHLKSIKDTCLLMDAMDDLYQN